MARPTKPRNVRKFPASTTYQPSDLGERKVAYEIGFDEFEAMRLTDLEHLSQEEVAEMMNISRQSIQLMLQNAREKLTRALLDGDTILLGGGHISIHHCPFVCDECNQSFMLKATNKSLTCPHCGSNNTHCTSTMLCAQHCAREK